MPRIRTVNDGQWRDPHRTTLDISTSHREDLIAALEAEHLNACDSSSCDICAAAEAGHYLASARLLSGATETPLLGLVDLAHRFNGTEDPDLGPDAEEADWQAWCEYFRGSRASGSVRRCSRCDAFTWNDSTCGNCLADLDDEDLTADRAHAAGSLARARLPGAPFRLVLDSALDDLEAESVLDLALPIRRALAAGLFGKRCPAT